MDINKSQKGKAEVESICKSPAIPHFTTAGQPMYVLP